MINVLVWLVSGGLVGWAAGRLAQSLQENVPVVQIVAGSLGALVGGVIFLIFDTTPLNAFNIGGLMVALIGSMVVVGIVHMVVRHPV